MSCPTCGTAISRPTAATTGVPAGTRLTHASAIPPAPWFSFNAGSGYPRFIIKSAPPDLALDSVDFTDVVVTVGNAAGSYAGLTFSRCRFAAPTVTSAGTSLTNLVSVTFPIAGLTFEDCEFNGVGPDVNKPLSSPVNFKPGCSGITFRRCRVEGVANAWPLADVDGVLIERCLARNLNVNKSIGYVRNQTVTPGTGGTMAAGDYRVLVTALTTRTTNGALSETVPPAVVPEVTVSDGGTITATWVTYSPNTGYARAGYRLYIGRRGAPGYDGYIAVPAAATTATYRGQALTPPDALPPDTSRWAHPDVLQLQGSYVRNLTFRFNDCDSRTPDGYSNSAGIQIGSMINGQVENLRYIHNWVDGSANHFNGYTNIAYSGAFEFTDNIIGGHYDGYLRHPNFDTLLKTIPCAVWARNVWASTGTTDTGVPMVAGQAIP